MKKVLVLLSIVFLGVTLTACSNDDDVLDGRPMLTKSLSDKANLLSFLTVEDGQWRMTISEQEAINLGKENEYSQIINQITEINERLTELKNDPKATLGFTLPNKERIIMECGEVIYRGYTSPYVERDNKSSFIKSMTANQSTTFSTNSSEYRITSTAYVQSMFIWSFELRDDKWGNKWNESGVMSANLSKNWIYALTQPGFDNNWVFSSYGTQTDGTNITFSFYK
ncbi:MAG: hypothetical protein ACRCR3_02820 [Tannerellaceae bacterium]